MGISKRWRSTALNSCSSPIGIHGRDIGRCSRLEEWIVAQAPPDVVGLRVLEEPWCASTYVVDAGSSGILPGAGPRPTSSSERQDPASGRRWRSPRRRTCPWVAAILRTPRLRREHWRTQRGFAARASRGGNRVRWRPDPHHASPTARSAVLCRSRSPGRCFPDEDWTTATASTTSIGAGRYKL